MHRTQDGTHIEKSALETLSVRAFRLEVDTGIVDVDGEVTLRHTTIRASPCIKMGRPSSVRLCKLKCTVGSCASCVNSAGLAWH